MRIGGEFGISLEHEADREAPVILTLMVQVRALEHAPTAQYFHAAVAEKHGHPVHLKESQLGRFAELEIQAAAGRSRKVRGCDVELLARCSASRLTCGSARFKTGAGNPGHHSHEGL